MAKKSLLNKLIIALLSLVCALSACAFFVACGSSENSTDDTDKTYSYSETDTVDEYYISNANFAYGTHNKTASEFPITSPTGWTRAIDNSAVSSNVNSGVIYVGSEDARNTLFDTLYADNEFMKAYEYQFATEIDGKTDEEKKDIIKSKFTVPSAPDGATDGFVYMLNNYSSANYGVGTAQKLTSSTTVSANKGEVFKISVKVKTVILNGAGANIRIKNSVNGNAQAEFRFDNITDTEWQTYTVYFVANADYDCTFSVILGLGYGYGYSDRTRDYVEGTAFFDDVKIEKSDDDIASLPESIVVFGSEEPISIDGATVKACKYNMSDMHFDTDYFTVIDASEQVYNLSSETKTVSVKNVGNTNFELNTQNETNYEKYAIVSLKYKNNLNYLGSTDISVNVVDIYEPTSSTETRKAIVTFSDVSDDNEFNNCIIVIKNNFKESDRKFYLELVIGTADSTTDTPLSDYASGTVVIKDVKYATGYVSSERYALNDKDTNYMLYSFFNAEADATVALYAGYEADYTEHDHSPVYSLAPAKGNIGEILTNPVPVNGYSGIIADHQYVKMDGTSTAVNDRLSFSNEKGYAGLINTKYINEYKTKDAGLENALNGLYGSENIQPIVIKNNTPDHYGFIGAQQTADTSAYITVSVKLKAIGDAKAFVYLVDTSSEKKDTLTFADFKVNTSEGVNNLNGTSYLASAHQFMLEITENTSFGDDNWVEVNFYIATGAKVKQFRVEVWNGGRDGSNDTASTGYVIINSIDVNTSLAFNEPDSWQSAFDVTDNPLYDASLASFLNEHGELIAYTRELSDKEISFNAEYPDRSVSYIPKYVWAKNDTVVYGIFNTIEPVENDPYADVPEEEAEGGCANSDPSTFWLSFSSIALAVVLILAITALFIKRLRLRRSYNKGETKAQYKVKSRTETQKTIKLAKERKMKAELENRAENAENKDDMPEAPETQQNAEITAENAETETEPDTTEQTGYVYGEVQDFGDMSFEIPEEKNDADKADKNE